MRQVNLGVSAGNHAALALYERLGFVAFGVERGFLLLDGVLYDEVQMACVLADRFVLRRAHSADAAAAAACVRAAYARWVPIIGREPAPMTQDYAALVAQGRTFVAEVDGKIAGVLVLEVNGESFVLDNVAVAPAFAGRGIGQALLRLAEHEARRAGFRSIELYTNELMQDNLERYRRIGYVETARREEHGFRRVFMRKPLL